jgi:hypothetical protein
VCGGLNADHEQDEAHEISAGRDGVQPRALVYRSHEDHDECPESAGGFFGHAARDLSDNVRVSRFPVSGAAFELVVVTVPGFVEVPGRGTIGAISKRMGI